MRERRLHRGNPRIYSFLQLKHTFLSSLGHLSCWRLLPLVHDFREGAHPCLSLDPPVNTLPVLVQITFCTAVGGTVWDKPPPQLSLLVFLRTILVQIYPVVCWREGHWPLDRNPSGKCSSTQYEIIERSSWEFEISCINLFISLLKENTKPQRNTKRMILNTEWF